MNKYIDISVPVSLNMPHWPGYPNIFFEQRLDLARGDEVTDSNVFFNVHTGTHVDAPSHFIIGGKTIDQLSLDVLIGKVFVAMVPDHISTIGKDILEDLNIPDGAIRLLLHTKNSRYWAEGINEFQPDFTALTDDGADWVVKRGIRLIGIDYLSIQCAAASSTTHQLLLNSEIVIIEGLNLTDVQSGWYKLICLPINLKGLEGAPARAILGEIE